MLLNPLVGSGLNPDYVQVWDTERTIVIDGTYRTFVSLWMLIGLPTVTPPFVSCRRKDEKKVEKGVKVRVKTKGKCWTMYT